MALATNRSGPTLNLPPTAFILQLNIYMIKQVLSFSPSGCKRPEVMKFLVKLVSSQVSSLALPVNKEGWSDPFKLRDEGIHPS